MSQVTATVMIALGSFGCDVAHTLKKRVRTRSENRLADIAVTELCFREDGESDREEQLHHVQDFLKKEINKQLALSSLVSLEPGESSLPRLDVFVVGDMADFQVRQVLFPVISTVEAVTNNSFSSLLGKSASRVLVMPILARLDTYSDDSSNEMKSLVDSLAQKSTLQIRTFLFERLTARYVLTTQQLISTIVALMEQLVLSGFRENVQIASFLRGDAPRAGASSDLAPFATAGLASVRIDAEILRAYCYNKASTTLVDGMRRGPDIGLEKREQAVRELRLDWDDVHRQLGLLAQNDVATDRFEKIIRDETPSLDCPKILFKDTPEDISERKYGQDWYESTMGNINAFVDRFEQRRMAELNEKIDGIGQRVADKRREHIRKTVDNWIWESPRGWAGARTSLRLLKDETAQKESEFFQRISNTVLPPQPDHKRIEQSVSDLHSETLRRPRTFRVWLTGLLFFLVFVLFGYPALNLLEQPFMLLDFPSWLTTAVKPPFSVALTVVAGLIIIPLAIRSMLKKRHAELTQVADNVERTLDKHLSSPQNSWFAHYFARLEFSRVLWKAKLAKCDRELLEEELHRLDELQRALDTLWNQLQLTRRKIEQHVENAEKKNQEKSDNAKRDLLLREVTNTSLLETVYTEAAPDNESLLEAFFAQLANPRVPWRFEVPMASLKRIEDFLSQALDLPPSNRLLSELSPIARRSAKQALAQALSELCTRLSPALGLTESALDGVKAWVICAPKDASDMVDDALESLRETYGAKALGADWARLHSPRDDGCIYIAVYVTHLLPSALGVYK